MGRIRSVFFLTGFFSFGFLTCVSTVRAQVRLLAADFTNGRLLEINPQTAAASIIGPMNQVFVASLIWDSTNQMLYATTSDSMTSLLLRVSPETGAAISVGPLGTFFMHGIEHSPLNDTLNAVASGQSGPRLYSINRTTGAATLIAPIALTGTVDIAFDPVSNTMFLAQVNAQLLHRLYLTNGATTLIGPFNAPGMPFPQVGIGLAFDPTLGLYATDNTGIPGNDNPLYRINPTTGHATLVGLTGATGLLGLFFIPEAIPLGDLNCDDVVDVSDIGPLVLALVDPETFVDQHPGCNPLRGDVNADGQLDGNDVQGLVSLLVP